MKASVLAGADVFLPLAKGARMPSTADDVCAETLSAALRAAADLRCGLDCLSVMAAMVPCNARNGTMNAATLVQMLWNECNMALSFRPERADHEARQESRYE